MSTQLPQITRRAFAFGISAAGGGLILGLSPSVAAAETPELAANERNPEVTVWVVIERDDTVVIRVARSEMGQGNFTSLPMLVAEELECDWARVRPEYVAPSENIARGRPWGDMVTAASLSIRASQAYLRKAGAQARMMLIAEAAARWGVVPEQCSARDSLVTHGPSGRTVRYGEIAEGASVRPVPQQVNLKSPQDWRLIGRSVKRFDIVDKTMGHPIYASDVRLPGMLYAAVAACPAHGGKLVSFDADKVSAMPGVRHVLSVGQNAVAVLATSWWHAKKALEVLPISWDEASSKDLSSEKIRDSFLKGLEAEDVAIGRKDGDADTALKSAHSIVSADYEVPYLAHITMEPQTCTAHVTEGGVEVWAPTQNGEGTLRVVAKTLGIDPSRVTVHKCHLGGGFGRRGLAQDWARLAVLIAKQVDQPVKMIWSREEDIRHDYYRPAFVGRHKAAFDQSGKLVGWKTRLCGSSIAFLLAQDRLKNGQDMEMMSAFLEEDMFYDVPNFEVGYIMRNTAVPVGFWRGVNHSQNGYIRECFIDELAHSRGKDPYLFRRELLANSPRSLAVLDEVAARANWGKSKEGIQQGIAIVECYDSVCAHVVEVSVDKTGSLKVHRVVVAIDSGYVVNPSIVVAQMEGAVAFGLIAALMGEITLTEGRVDQSNFHDYPALRMNEMPPVETYLVPSRDKYIKKWGGIGEPGVPPLAPALVNAIFAATGRRIRSLPLKNHDLTPI
jgi:isoquinoline 1-oxidoreductase beta subunit